MPLLFLLLVSCSGELPYNQSAPHISIDILTASDTIITGDTVHFQAKANVKNYYWTVNDSKTTIPYLQFRNVFEKSGDYNVKFYAVDLLGDTLSASISIGVSKPPYCENINLDFFQGSPVFKWECKDDDIDDILTYNFTIKNKEDKIFLDTVLSEPSLMLGKALPGGYLKANLTATDNYGFKDTLEWSRDE